MGCDTTAFDDPGLERVRKRMATVDAMPPDLRACVHDFGLTIVTAMLQAGVTNHRHIRHLVDTVRIGSIEIGNRQETDEMRQEVGRRYARYLRNRGFLVVPELPSETMIRASIDALHDEGIADFRVNRHRKHAIRLVNANVAGHMEHQGKGSLLKTGMPT